MRMTMATYDLNIYAELCDTDGNQIARLDRTYTVTDMGQIQSCFEHATKTSIMLVNGIGMETGPERDAEAV